MPTRSSFRLPTFAAFRRLRLPARTKLFKQWVANQPPGKAYNAMSHIGCPFSQFGTALLRKRRKVWGWSEGFEHTTKPTMELADESRSTDDYTKVGDWKLWHDIVNSSTFGLLASRLKS